MESVTGKNVAVLEPAVPTGTQLITLDPGSYVTQVFAPFKDRLAAAQAEATKVTTVDVSTKSGMAVAVKHRAVFRTLRIEAENERAARKAPILAIGKLLDSRYKEIEAEVLKEEGRFDAAIKAEERRKEEERQAAIRAEQERLAAEERARKEAEEKRLAEERAEIARLKAELERREAEALEAAARAQREQEERERQARLKIEEEERAARRRREEEDRQARAAREEADRKAREQQERNQAALSEIQGIQQQVIIAQTGRAGVRAGGTIECIEATLAETEAWDIDAQRFGVFTVAAFKAKEEAVAQIRALLAAAKARAAEDAKMKAERERLEAERTAAEEAQRKARLAKELKEAAERRAEEERQSAERDRLEAEARARAEEERKAREAEDARQREMQRLHAEWMDGRQLLESFVERFGHREEFSEVTADIKEFLADVPVET